MTTEQQQEAAGAAQRLTTTGRQLAELVQPVLPFVDRSSWAVPILGAVRIQRRAGWLTATASDRYRAAMKRVAVDEPADAPDFTALLAAPDLRRVLALFRGTKSHDPAIAVEVTGGVATFTSSDGLADFGALQVTVGAVLGDFPRAIDLLLSRAANRPIPLTAHVDADPKLLAGLTVSGKRVRLFGVSPTMVGAVIGDDLLALMVTERHDAPDLATWAELLPAPDFPAEAAAS